jgi:hypothetical protein
MASVNLYTKFDWTDEAGNLYSDGSTSTAKTITAATGEIFDRTYSIGSGVTTEILNDDLISDFDFLWIESDKDAEIQLVCNEGGTLSGNNIENGWVVKLVAGVPFVLANDDSRNMGNMDGTFGEPQHQDEIDNWETHWPEDTIDRIEYYQTGSVAKVRVVAIT